MKCPNCDFDSPAEMRFCGMCGTSLTRTCPSCQYVNPITYQYCGMCGTFLYAEGSTRTAGHPPYSQAQPPQRIFPTAQPQTPANVLASQASGTLPGVSLDGERRVATVMFADVKGSTELLEHLGTEEWVQVMNNLFQVLETEIYRFCGEVGQFRGDGLVAFFGAKMANEDDPEHAVLAALAMQEAIKPYAGALAQKEGIKLIMRVGVNTGEIIVANVGDTMQYSEDTAMGEALTIAARMESSAEPGTVLVSESTYRLVRDRFEWVTLGEIMVKGISYPIPVFRPLTARRIGDIPSDMQAFGLPHGVIGRKAEHDVIIRNIESLYSGRGGILLITGVKGMGKTFLVNEARQHYSRQNALMLAAVQNRDPGGKKAADGNIASTVVRWMHGRCRSYGHLRPYSMWFDLLHEWIGTQPEDQASEIMAVLRAQVESQADRDVEKEYPNLATFISAPTEEAANERLRHLDAEGLKSQFFQTVHDWIRDMAEKGPIVVSLADMQWADTTSLELLEYCLPLCDTESVLWLLVGRPDRDSPMWEFQHKLETNYPHRLSHLNLPPLSYEESSEFIDRFLGQEVISPETKMLIIRKAEGNPYFIKELIYSLVANGTLAKDGEQEKWRQTRDIASLELPDSLQTLLMARIDRLTPGERRVLQMAAVIGSTFWLNAFYALAGPGASLHQIQADLVSLQRAGLVHERAYVEDLGMEYAFDSSLIREVAYESLLNSQRIAYHLKVAEFLEEIVFREGKPRYFNTLAHHYWLAGDLKKELFYTLQAAERARNIYANAEALRYYTRALDLLNNLEDQHSGNGSQQYAIWTQKFEALNGRRAVNFLIGNIVAGVTDARALLPLARLMEQDPTWLIDALLQQPGVAYAENRDELTEGIPLAMEALHLAEAIGDKQRQIRCLLAIASQRNLLNDPTWVDVGDKALEMAREIGDREYEMTILLGLGQAYVGRDELQKGMDYLNAAQPIYKELHDRGAEMTYLRAAGAQYERVGAHYQRLVDFEQKRLAIAREIGNRFEEANALLFCGQIQALNLGDLEGGKSLLQEALKILGSVSDRIFPLLRIAQVQIALGQYEEAGHTIAEANPVAVRNMFDLSRVGLKLVTAMLYNALGDTRHLEAVASIADEIIRMEEGQLISRQYRMAAACEASTAYLGLARESNDESQRLEYHRRALQSSSAALEVYHTFGYVNVIECASEEIFFRHSQTLSANDQKEASAEYLGKAYDEMIRKLATIPAESPFRRMFLENIPIHREIRAANAAASIAKIVGSQNL